MKSNQLRVFMEGTGTSVTTRASHLVFALALVLAVVSGCSKTYYSAMEKVGIHKRDIMVDRVEDARDAQAEAQKQFSSALEQFGSVVGLEETDLNKAYERLNTEYERSRKAAEEVSARIGRVETVAEDLFDEWQRELGEYQNRQLRRSSEEKLKATRSRYGEMLASMHRAEDSMAPVLRILRDNVLYLKHNLNAQAIGSLKGEFAGLKGEIAVLVQRMSQAIQSSNSFIEHMNR